jgi:SAM-dependent methyltransferase
VAWALDYAYLRRLIADGTVKGPVLEIGSIDYQGGDGNARSHCQAAGLEWEGADLVDGPGVDRTFDVTDPAAVDAITDRWQTVLLFNLLEHTYDPISALRNATRLLGPGGVVVVSGPTIWELHDYPVDCWRPMPGFFFEFARREGHVTVVPGSPTWLVNDRLLPLEALRDGEQFLAPSNRWLDELHGARQGRWVRLIDGVGARLGRRGYAFPFCSFGIALRSI